MRMHSELRIPINRDWAFSTCQCTLADSQTVLQDFRCADALVDPHKPSIGLFDVPMHTRGLQTVLQDFRCANALADPHKPSVGLFDVPMHTRGLPNRVAGLSMCRCTRGPPQTIHRIFRCTDALAGSKPFRGVAYSRPLHPVS